MRVDLREIVARKYTAKSGVSNIPPICRDMPTWNGQRASSWGAQLNHQAPRLHMNNPQSLPLTDADNLDAVGVRQTGGIDLVIVCSGPLDESDQTIELLTRKVKAYAQLAASPNLFQHFEAEAGPVRIFVSCEFTVSPRATQTLDSLGKEIAAGQLELRLVKDMNDV